MEEMNSHNESYTKNKQVEDVKNQDSEGEKSVKTDADKVGKSTSDLTEPDTRQDDHSKNAEKAHQAKVADKKQEKMDAGEENMDMDVNSCVANKLDLMKEMSAQDSDDENCAETEERKARSTPDRTALSPLDQELKEFDNENRVATEAEMKARSTPDWTDLSTREELAVNQELGGHSEAPQKEHKAKAVQDPALHVRDRELKGNLGEERDQENVSMEVATLDFSEEDEMRSTPDWFTGGGLDPQEDDEMRSTPDWFTGGGLDPQEAREEHVMANAPKKHLARAGVVEQDVEAMNFMEDDETDGIQGTPDWCVPGELNPMESEEEPATSTPEWFVPGNTNVQTGKNVRMKQTARRDRVEITREEVEETMEGETYERPTKTHVQMPIQPRAIRYPLPDKSRLLQLPIFNTYHHHHIHQARRRTSDSSLESSSTDPSFHIHTSVNKVLKMETRLFTTFLASSLPNEFKLNNPRITVLSSEPATYSMVIVKQDSLEFVHHIVHRHDMYIFPEDRPFFSVSSIATQTCTRTKSQCRLFGSVGQFFHYHFHEHIHSIFIKPPRGEVAMEYHEYIFLGVTHVPTRRDSKEEGSTNPCRDDPSTSTPLIIQDPCGSVERVPMDRHSNVDNV